MQPCFAPDFGGIASSYSPFHFMLLGALLYIAFIILIMCHEFLISPRLLA